MPENFVLEGIFGVDMNETNFVCGENNYNEMLIENEHFNYNCKYGELLHGLLHGSQRVTSPSSVTAFNFNVLGVGSSGNMILEYNEVLFGMYCVCCCNFFLQFVGLSTCGA